jgi:hypothetical protein
MNQFAEDLGLDKPRQRRTLRIPAPQRPHALAGDAFAPFAGPHRCRSLSGRWRERHDFCVERRDGLHCVFCDKRLEFVDEESNETN